MIPLDQLNSELHNDPVHIGYATLLAAGNTAATAAALNARSGPGAGVLTMASVPHDLFIASVLPELASFYTTLASLPAAKQTLYSGALQMMLTSKAVLPAVPSTQSFLASMVGDGLLSSTALTSITTRTCSRAEALWGENSSVSQMDVVHALVA